MSEEFRHLFEDAVSRLSRGDVQGFVSAASRFSSRLGYEEDPLEYLYKAEILERAVSGRPIVRVEYSRHVLGQSLLLKDEVLVEAYRLRADALKCAYKVMVRVVGELEDYYRSPIHRVLSFWVLRDLRVGRAYISSGTSQPEELYNLGSLLAKCVILKYPLERVGELIDLAWLTYAHAQAQKHAAFYRKLQHLRSLEECRARFKVEMLRLGGEVEGKFGFVASRLETLDEEDEATKLSYELHRSWYEWLGEHPGKLPAPFFLIPSDYWSGGVLPRRGVVTLRPYRFPPFPKAGRTMLNAVFGVLGSGKTNFLNALAVYRLDRRGFGLRLEIDHQKRLQCQLMATPLDELHPAYSYVVNVEKLRPRPVDVVSLVVVRGDSDLKRAKPPLKIDRVVYVENPLAFHLPWDLIYKPGRLVCLKFVTMDLTFKAYVSLLKSFLEFRGEKREAPMFVQVEEAMMGASAKVSMMYSRSGLMASEEVEILVQGMRGLGLALEFSTQRPSYIISSARGQASNVFSGHMAPQDLEAVFEGLPNTGEFETAKRVLGDGSISFSDSLKWFLWIDKSRNEVRFVRASVPPCGAEISTVDPLELFEKHGILAEGWEEVPRLVEEPLPERVEFLPEKVLEKREKREEKAKRSEDKFEAFIRFARLRRSGETG